MNNGGQPSLGLYATPLGDATNYMAVLGGGSEKIAFSSQMNTFGLYWGSVDTYNFVEFFNGNTSVAMISGIDVPAAYAREWRPGGLCLERLRRDDGALPFFDSVVVSSSANSFEFDNVLAGVRDDAVHRRGSGAFDVGHAAGRLCGSRIRGLSAKQGTNLGPRLTPPRI